MARISLFIALRSMEESTGCPQILKKVPIFFRGGSHIWPRFSRVFFLKNVEFLCSLERKFPEFFKTHPTFVFSSLLKPSTARQTLITLFLGHPVFLFFPFSRNTEQGWEDTDMLSQK